MKGIHNRLHSIRLAMYGFLYRTYSLNIHFVSHIIIKLIRNSLKAKNTDLKSWKRNVNKVITVK